MNEQITVLKTTALSGSSVLCVTGLTCLWVHNRQKEIENSYLSAKCAIISWLTLYFGSGQSKFLHGRVQKVFATSPHQIGPHMG
jgi:uncharacterized membrane protein